MTNWSVSSWKTSIEQMEAPSDLKATEDLVAAFFHALRPPREMSLHQWAETHYHLSAESSSEPGRWITIPYQVGIMNAISDRTIRKVSCMKSARVGYTKIIVAAIGYHAHYDPCSILVLQPTEDDAKGFSTEEIQPMFRDVQVLAGKLRQTAEDGRAARQTMLKMQTGGGTLTVAGAKTPRNFRRITVRKVIRDEVDAYEVTKEGDPIKLSAKRMQTASHPQEINGSTPTLKGLSMIEREFAASDQRYFLVPCPHCGHRQRLVWGGVRWESGNPGGAWYQCEANGCVIEEKDKADMVAAGEWVASKPYRGHAGFHISSLYSPFPGAAWGLLAQEFLEAKAGGASTLQVFINTVLGETWDGGDDVLEPDALVNRREAYPADTLDPRGVLVTAGVDIQDDRFELEFVAWAANDETWSLDYVRHYGDPSGKRFWAALDEALGRQFSHPSGLILRVETACVDTGGSYTQEAYRYVGPRFRQRIFGIKGSSDFDAPIWPSKPTFSAKAGAKIFVIGVGQCKLRVVRRLEVKTPGPGYCHFPDRYEPAHFDQICAEKLVTRYVKGFPMRSWQKPAGARNEAFDCRVYATAARMSLNLDLHKRSNEYQAGRAVPQSARPRSSQAEIMGGRQIEI